MFFLANESQRGLSGFLPFSRASLMLDIVFLAMFVIVPLLLTSIHLARHRLQYTLHKRLQLAMAGVLLFAVGMFEIDMQLFTDWESLAADSPYFDPANKWGSPVGIGLLIHLSFAVPTLVLWVLVVVQALRKFPSPPVPAAHSRWHRRFGWLAAAGMLLTAATGWAFYWLAFVAAKSELMGAFYCVWPVFDLL
jgi:hypothetical protein